MGSVVLFRYWDSIVGEAIVSKESVWEQERERTWSGEEVEYVGHVTFSPSSIRLYSPPLPALCLQQLMDDSGVGKDILQSATSRQARQLGHLSSNYGSGGLTGRLHSMRRAG